MKTREFYQSLIERLLKESVVETTLFLEGERFLEHTFGQAETKGDQVFSECLSGKPEVVLCGGGHVSLALSKLLDLLDYSVIVLDDREEFVNAQRFPMAKALYLVDFEKDLPIFSDQASYLILTRGHQADYTCLSKVLRRKFAYAGMIGSRTKVALSIEKLRKEGFLEEQISKLHAPIGLPIGGSTPMEIGVSIVAELISERAKEERYVFDPAVMEGLMKVKETCILVTILETEGSVPRGKGSRMLILPDGKIYGSVGGGAIEYSVLQRALCFGKEEKACIEEYELTNADAAGLGMVCGGRVRVLFERIEGKEESVSCNQKIAIQ